MDEKIYTRNYLRLPNLKYNGNKQLNKIMKVIVIFSIAFIVAFCILKSIRPIMEAQCKNMAKSVATKIANKEAKEVTQNYSYNDIVIIRKDERGNATMIGTNIITLNKIVSDISIKIQEKLENIKENSFNIRLGSFLGSEIFSGVGPNIRIKMELVGNIDTELKSEFETSGINQTLHKIYMEISCNVVILTPYETLNEKIVNQILLAEDVIIGDVPNSYYEPKEKY